MLYNHINDVEKKPGNRFLYLLRILIGPLAVILAALAFFITYNTYLIDNSLENLKFSLNKISTAQTLEDARNLKMILSEALIKEVSAEKLDTVNVANLEFSQNIISEAKINDQLKDLKLVLTTIVKTKAEKRSKILLALDALNEKVQGGLIDIQKRLRGKKKPGIEVSDLSLLDKARKAESDWLIDEAVQNYRLFISQYPDYKDIGWVKLRLGYAYLKTTKMKEAERIFSSVRGEYAGGDEALVAQKFLVKMKEIGKSLKGKEALLKRLEAAKSAEEKQKIYYNLGVAETYNYNLGSARDFFKKAIDLEPKSLLAQKAQFNIGWSLKFQNDLEKSALVFEDVINIYAKGDIVLNAKYQLADTYHKSGKFEEAIAIYKKIAQDYKDKPIAPLAQFQAGYSYLYNMNDPIQASDTFRSLSTDYGSSALANYAAVDLVPTLESRFRDYAFSLLIEGKYDKAREAFEKAIGINKNDAWAHSGLGSCFLRLGNLKESLLETDTGMNILADEYTYAAYAFCLEMEGKIDGAIESYKKSIIQNKNYLVAHYNLGRLYEMQARYDDAISEYKEAIRIDPKFPQAHANLAHAHWFKGDTAYSIEGYTAAIGLRPDFPEAHYNLGLIYKTLGKKMEAKKEFEEALKSAPDFKEAKEQFERIK